MRIRRLYPDLRLTTAITGRLTTKGFPVLGLPKHSYEAKAFRNLVVAPPEYSIYEADYNQIELRAAAHLSGDKGMIRAFEEGIDLHALTAHLVLGAPAEKEKQIESDHRLPAKAGNFGYWMGLSEKGLTEQIHKAGNLDWAADCKGCKYFNAEHAADCPSVRFFRMLDEKFPGAPRYRSDRIKHAVRTGFAFGMWDMEWYLPGVWSPHEEVAEGTKRQAFALPIQEGAQRLIKQAMAIVNEVDIPWAQKVTRNPRVVFPILQIHDSLIFLVLTSFIEQWNRRIVATMTGITRWKVPITVKGTYGPSWADQKAA